MKKILPIVIIAIVVLAGGAFYGGMLYAKSTVSASGNSQFRFQQFGGAGGGQGGQRGIRSGGGAAAGEIISKDDKSITVKLRDGGSKIIFFSDTTEITKSVGGVVADLEIGKTVMADGTANQDGSVTAKTIQLRAALTAPVAPAAPTK